MKKLLLGICALLLYCMAWGALAEGEPEIVLTYVPAYGEYTDFEGFVRNCADPENYRVTLYLQVTEYGEMWVKPTAATPYVTLDENAVFHLDYTSGGNDRYAVRLHLLLISKDYFPSVHGFYDALDNAFDYVCVYRTEDGEVTVSPDRYNNSQNLNYAPNVGGLVMDVGFYTDGGYPGNGLRQSLITAQLNAIAPFTDGVRYYGAAGEMYPAYRLAQECGYSLVLGGAYLCGDEEADQRELDALIEHCNNGYCSLAIVGNETLLTGKLSESQLLAYMEYVRQRVSVPVTTSDSVHELMNRPLVLDACDVLLPNIYPYWGNVPLEDAAQSLKTDYNDLKRRARGKQIIISETGYPSNADQPEGAPEGAGAAAYFEEVWQWAMERGVIICWFEAADEPYKASEEGVAGAHWGFMTKDLVLKEGYANTTFFGNLPPAGNPRYIGFTNDDGVAFSLLTDGDGRLALPECAFIPPEGMEFRGWLTDHLLLLPGTEYVFQQEITLHSLWRPLEIAAISAEQVGNEAFYNTDVRCVVLEAGCAAVGARAFAQCGQLTLVEMPASVAAIGQDAFAGSPGAFILAPLGSAPLSWAEENGVAWAGY